MFEYVDFYDIIMKDKGGLLIETRKITKLCGGLVDGF